MNVELAMRSSPGVREPHAVHAAPGYVLPALNAGDRKSVV